MSEQFKEIAKRFKEFCEAGHGDYVFLNLRRPVDNFKAEVERDGNEVLDLQVRDGAVRKVKYVDEEDDLTRSDKFDGSGVLERIHQKSDGDRVGLQVDKKDDEWQLECRTKTLSSDLTQFLLGPELGEVSDTVKALLSLVDSELFSGLEKEKVYLALEDGRVLLQVGKGKKAVKHRF